MMQYLTVFESFYSYHGIFSPAEQKKDMMLMLVFLIFHQVTIDVASPEAGVIQKVR